MKRISFVLVGVLIAVLAVLAGYAGYRYASAPVAPVSQPEQCPLASAKLHDRSGQLLAPSAWRGQVVLLNFWASWCGPCRHELPALQATAKRYAPRGVKVIGVAVDEPASAQRLARELGIHYPLLYGQSAADELLKSCSAGKQGLPQTVVLDRQGKVCARHAGGLDEGGFTRLLRPCLQR